MLAGQVEQFAADLQGGEAEEAARVSRHDLPHRAVEPQRGVLHDVVGIVPAAHAGKPAEHPVGHGADPFGGDGEQFLAGASLSGGELPQAVVQPGVEGIGLAHGGCSIRSRSPWPMAAHRNDGSITRWGWRRVVRVWGAFPQATGRPSRH